MASNHSTVQLPNPFTPMAFLPPDIAYEITVSTYFLVGSLAVLIWDILNNLKGDFKLLTQFRVSIPTIVYFISRIGSLGYVLAATIFETAHLGNCAEFQKVLCALYPVAIPATSLLFFFRVRAVFDGNKLVIAFFAFMWLAVLGGCITVTQGVGGSNIGQTNYCLNSSIESYVSAGAIIPLINDTLVFFAISFRLLTNTHLDFNLKSGLKKISGAYLPAFTRSFLQDGQVYYLTTVTTNLLAVIMLYIYSVPVAYRTMFTVPNITMMNIMACQVFRKTKFGVFRGEQVSSSSVLKSRKDMKPSSVIPLSFREGNNRSSIADPRLEGNGVEITKIIQSDYDFCGNERSGEYSKKHGMV